MILPTVCSRRADSVLIEASIVADQHPVGVAERRGRVAAQVVAVQVSSTRRREQALHPSGVASLECSARPHRSSPSSPTAPPPGTPRPGLYFAPPEGPIQQPSCRQVPVRGHVSGENFTHGSHYAVPEEGLRLATRWYAARNAELTFRRLAVERETATG